MKRYKIVCSDLDGTLLNSDSDISRENLEAIDELVSRGICFVPSTGRCLAELPAKLTDDPSIRYIIYSNGAVVLDRQTGRRIQTCLSGETARAVLDILRNYEIHLSVRHDGCCHVDAAYANEAAYDYYNVSHEHRVVVNDFANIRTDFQQFCYETEDFEVISAFFRSYEELLACQEELRRLGGLRTTGSNRFNLEIMNIRAGKGNALISLADMLGVDCADAISVGDSDNDSSIIEAAGLGLAVSNACRSLQEAADAVICSNDDHVAAYILSHYF